jgi:hypothetical protein
MSERIAALEHMLRKIERVPIEDTSVLDHECCGCALLLKEVRAALAIPAPPFRTEVPDAER